MWCSAVSHGIWRAETSAACQWRCSATACTIRPRTVHQVMPPGLRAHLVGSTAMKTVFVTAIGPWASDGHTAPKLLQVLFVARCASWWWSQQLMAASTPRWWRGTRGRWKAVASLWWPSPEPRLTWRMGKCRRPLQWSHRQKKPVGLCTGIESAASDIRRFTDFRSCRDAMAAPAPQLSSLMRHRAERETLQLCNCAENIWAGTECTANGLD